MLQFPFCPKRATQLHKEHPSPVCSSCGKLERMWSDRLPQVIQPHSSCFWAGDGQCCCLLLSQIKILPEDKWPAFPHQKIRIGLRSLDVVINIVQNSLWGTLGIPLLQKGKAGGRGKEAGTSFSSATLCLVAEPACINADGEIQKQNHTRAYPYVWNF